LGVSGRLPAEPGASTWNAFPAKSVRAEAAAGRIAIALIAQQAPTIKRFI
jgi:hypothetical protein